MKGLKFGNNNSYGKKQPEYGSFATSKLNAFKYLMLEKKITLVP